MADFTVTNHGSLWLVRPNTDAARDHFETEVDPNGVLQWFAGALVVEPRYVVNFAEQLVADGFTLAEVL